MFYLSKEQIITINRLQVEGFGGKFAPPQNFLKESGLDYLLEIIDSEMFGEPLYPSIYQKAGLYMHSIVSNHVFQDGNKRTGLQSAHIFMKANGYFYKKEMTDETLINFTISVAAGDKTLEEVQHWFEENIEKV
ncbi:type II toxin-antitoxin system death-on-curing family toxin [Bernardetia sp.]|uniref:type II toxin-antitoxin system death-on-curing family toxin n=1 Tax=Bernardetia sp. TaxID=1937974 RepID=UPI0025BC6AB5|nr:Fic family protein [Bernardetia sp.]